MLIRPIAEAISIADQVIVLSKRPAHIKRIFDIYLDNNKGPLYGRNCSSFHDYYQKIWEVFDHEI